jgi:hypothetical protein
MELEVKTQLGVRLKKCNYGQSEETTSLQRASQNVGDDGNNSPNQAEEDQQVLVLLVLE